MILEAQASGLPVVAVAAGGPLSLIEHRVSGLLCEPDAARRSPTRVLELADSPLLREHLARADSRRSGSARGSGRSSVLPTATGMCCARTQLPELAHAA